MKTESLNINKLQLNFAIYWQACLSMHFKDTNLPSLKYGQLQSLYYCTRDKRTLVAIINNYKTVWNDLDILFISWVIFSNFFLHEKWVFWNLSFHFCTYLLYYNKNKTRFVACFKLTITSHFVQVTIFWTDIQMTATGLEPTTT